MKRWLVIAVLLLAGVVRAQVTTLPDAGELLWRSKDRQGLTSGCVLTFSFADHRFHCAEPRLVSIYRDAATFNVAVTNGAVLSSPGDGRPQVLTFPSNATAVAYADWIMPSVDLTGHSILLSWTTTELSAGTVQWRLDWCVFEMGQAPCAPSGEHVLLLPSLSNGVDLRHDATVNPWPWVTAWAPNAHVVLSVTRAGYDPGQDDTLNGDALLQGLRLEYVQ